MVNRINSSRHIKTTRDIGTREVHVDEPHNFGSSHQATIETLETELLLEALYQLHGLDFRGYAASFLLRRLRQFINERGIDTISILQDQIIRSRDIMDALVRTLSLRLGKLFDNDSQTQSFRKVVAPYLRSCPLPKIWIAESTSPEDVFELVILLVEENLYDKTLIFITAADENMLNETRAGCFVIDDFLQYEENYKRCGGKSALTNYCTQHNGHMVFKAALRKNLIWAQYDLTTDRSFNEFQFIYCRRVLPEFGPQLRRRALQLFADSLSPFGVLNIDILEELQHTAMGLQFQLICQSSGLYRRVL
jgi:chemotaxis protein methyltransferase CheR